MEDNILRIQKNYNDAINICYTNPNSYISATNPTICAVEQLERSSVGERVSALHSERALAAGIQLSSDEDEIDPMYKRMCGCRLTTRIIFVMLLLGINEPIGPEFMWIYGKLLHHNINNTIMRGLNIDKLSGKIPIVEREYYINESLEEISDLFIVQILKRVNRRVSMYDLVPVHSFIVIMYPDRSCGVISSWYGGFDGGATPLIYNKISFEELQGVLTPKGLINTEYTDILFGKGNNLEGDLKPIFISKEAIIYGMEFAGIEFAGLELGGGGGRRKRTNKKRKTRRNTRRNTRRKTRRKTRRNTRRKTRRRTRRKS